MSKGDLKRLGDYIREVDVRNKDGAIKLSQGICNQKYFQNPKQVSATPKADKIVRTGQFAYNRATTRNGDKISIALRVGPDCTVSSAYCVFFVTDTDVIDPHWLWLWFKRPDFDRYAIFKSHGSAHEFFEFETLCNTYIDLPPIEKQREIVARHQAIEHRIEINRKTIARLEEAAQAIYRKMFVDDIDPENLPDGWRLGVLSDISMIICRGKSPEYNDESDQIIIGQRCVRNHCVSLAYARTHNAKPSHTELQFGDILINSTGLGSLGRVGQIYFNPTNTSFDSHVTLVRTAPHLMLYAGAYLATQEKSIEDLAKGSTGQTELAADDVRAYPIIIPPKDIVDVFNKRITPIVKYSEVLRSETEKYQYLLSNILR